MRQTWDLGEQDWTLRGFRQNDWRWETSFARFDARTPDIAGIPARVPGSVRGALVAAGIVPRPYDGLASRDSEWIENRHWSYTTAIPASAVDAARSGARIRLRAQSLDSRGTVLVDDTEAGSFESAMTPTVLDVTGPVRAGASTLTIVFTSPPDELGQIAWTSRIRDGKARFNYGWDWMPRVVQLGIAGPIELEAVRGVEIERFDLVTDRDPGSGVGILHYRARASGVAEGELLVTGGGHRSSRPALLDGEWHAIEVAGVAAWTVHPDGEQALYDVALRVAHGDDADERVRRTGFRSVRWLPAEGAPADAEPWILELDGEPTFLAGVNWVPIRPDYADVTESEVRARLDAYRGIGINTLRVWGGASRESDAFYRLADELGFLVWQELPLSSSGLDNLPPDDDAFVAGFAEVAAAYAEALAPHPSLVLWGGGNELASAGADTADPMPATLAQPALAAAGRVLARDDPSRRFVPSSPSGPRAWARAEEYGQGVHHDVHGPWSWEGDDESWRRYWDEDDSLLRSEVGVDGASPYGLLVRYGLAGPTSTPEERERLATIWGHSSAWWLKRFRAWDGEGTLEEWVARDQRRQAELLGYAAAATRRRFPRCGGFIVWLGHDAFPCPTSLSLLDFDGTVKPVGAALAAAFTG